MHLRSSYCDQTLLSNYQSVLPAHFTKRLTWPTKFVDRGQSLCYLQHIQKATLLFTKLSEHYQAINFGLHIFMQMLEFLLENFYKLPQFSNKKLGSFNI